MSSLFGTDGIRGKVGVAPITPEGFLRLGWSLGKVLSDKTSPLIVVGRDTRLSGSPLSLACISGLLSAGCNVIDCGVMPTPGVAHLVKSYNAQAGIVISASHNLYMDNGIKIFDAHGYKLSAEIEQKITQHYLSTQDAIGFKKHCGSVEIAEDGGARYTAFLKAQVPQLNLTGMKIAVDAANGAGSGIASALFTELGAEVIAIGDSPDGLNINDSCGATDINRLQRCVVEHRCALGIALDGDGDRIMMVDHEGSKVDGDQIVFLLAKAWHSQKRLKGGIAGTLMSNLGQEQALEKLGIPFARAKVGDVHVLNLMLEKHWNLGGESSGHVICLDHATTGDGLMTALLVLEVLVSSSQSLAQLAAQMPLYPSILVNVVTDSPKALMTEPKVTQAIVEAEKALGFQGRVLVRASGTEPVIRVMVEGKSSEIIQAISAALVSSIKAVVEQSACHGA